MDPHRSILFDIITRYYHLVKKMRHYQNDYPPYFLRVKLISPSLKKGTLSPRP